MSASLIESNTGTPEMNANIDAVRGVEHTGDACVRFYYR